MAMQAHGVDMSKLFEKQEQQGEQQGEQEQQMASKTLVRASVGTVCFSIEPKTQNIYLLLGKETCFDNLRSAKGVWCDFGGKPLPGESAEATAAREMEEEGLGLLLPGVHPLRFREEMRRQLEMQQFEARIHLRAVTHWASNMYRRLAVQRVYFLKELPWLPQLPQKFSELRDDLLAIKRGTKEAKPPRTHPALTYNDCGMLTVDPHYLEKHSMQWWSLDRLREVVANNGRFKNQRFRGSFMRALRIVVQRLWGCYHHRDFE